MLVKCSGAGDTERIGRRGTCRRNIRRIGGRLIEGIGRGLDKTEVEEKVAAEVFFRRRGRGGK